MDVLEIEKLRFSYKDKELFNNLDVRIFNNEHINILLNNIQEHSDKYYDDVMFCKSFQQYYNKTLDVNNIKTVVSKYDIDISHIEPMSIASVKIV